MRTLDQNLERELDELRRTGQYKQPCRFRRRLVGERRCESLRHTRAMMFRHCLLTPRRRSHEGGMLIAASRPLYRRIRPVHCQSKGNSR